MKKYVNYLLKVVMFALAILIVFSLYCKVGDIPFRTWRLIGADVFLFILVWFIYEFLNPQIDK